MTDHKHKKICAQKVKYCNLKLITILSLQHVQLQNNILPQNDAVWQNLHNSGQDIAYTKLNLKKILNLTRHVLRATVLQITQRFNIG